MSHHSLASQRGYTDEENRSLSFRLSRRVVYTIPTVLTQPKYQPVLYSVRDSAAQRQSQ